MHTAELDSAVIVTSSRPARSLTSRRFAHSGARLCGGMHITKLSFLRNFVSCDSPVWCTPWNSDSAWNFWRYFVFLTLLGDAHCTVHPPEMTTAKSFHRGVHHTVEFLKQFNIYAKSKKYSKILLSVNQGPRWAWIIKMVEIPVTHSF